MAVRGKKGEIINEKEPAWPWWASAPPPAPEIRRCRVCGVRKVLGLGFYRDRKGRGGYRRECKRCHNRARARWARGRYVPKAGRRYVTKGDRRAGALRP